MKAPKPAAKKKSRVLIVDDHPIMLDGLRVLINQEPDLVVCAEAQDAGRALAAIATSKPDLVITDITLPGKSGLELVKDLAAMHPDLPVLVVSMHDEALYAERVLRAGARGYAMKHDGGEKLLRAIRHVLSGQIFVSEKMSARIVEIFSTRRSSGSQSPVGKLSDREFEIFQLIGQGLTTQDAADRLHISAKTVETHRLSIKTKLGIGSAVELVAYSARWSAEGGGGSAPGKG